MQLHKFSHELLKYLELKDKVYSLDDIKSALLLKTNAKLNNIKILIVLDNEGHELFYGTKTNFIPKIKLESIMTIIKNNFIIKNNKPFFEVYEYIQKPINITNLCENIDI